MKRKALSLALVLALCLGLMTPVCAANSTADYGPIRDYQVGIRTQAAPSQELGARSFQVRNWDYNEETEVYTKGAAETFTPAKVSTLPAGAEIVVESPDGHIPNAGMICRAWSDPDGDGVYDARISWVDYYEDAEKIVTDDALLDAGVSGPFTASQEETEDAYRHISSIWGMSCEGTIYFLTTDYGSGIDGKPAVISADDLIRIFGADTLFCLGLENGYDSAAGRTRYVGHYFLITQSRQPAKSETAAPTNDQLTVNGALQNPTVYKIDGNNYFKIRDLAAVLNGTEKQFDVGYDAALKSVTATTGKGYEKLPTDLAGAPTGGNQQADPSNDAIYIDGQKIDVTVYKINGSNYFKLRDLGKALNFYVGWTREDGVFIDTGKPYSE